MRYFSLDHSNGSTTNPFSANVASKNVEIQTKIFEQSSELGKKNVLERRYL